MKITPLIIASLMLAVVRCPFPSYAEDSKIIFSSHTEENLRDTVSPPKGLIDVVLNSDYGRERATLVVECMAELHIKGTEKEKLFEVSLLPVKSSKTVIYFVRPMFQPFCDAFYGAHTFMYWLVAREESKQGSRWRIIFESNDDAVDILASSTYGFPDIQTVGHWNAVALKFWKWQYDGKKYMNTSSRIESFK